MKIRIIITLVLVLSVYSAVYAQNTQNNMKSNTENIFFECLTFPSSDSQDSSVVYFFYKIRLSELIFDKSDELKLNSFSAYPMFDIEIKDNSGIIRKRLFQKDTVTIDDYSLLNKLGEYYEGFFKTKLSTFDYVVRYQVTVNNRDIYDKRINLENSKKNELNIIGNPLLVNIESGTESNYIPAILNNSIDIKSTNPAFLLFTNPIDKRIITASVTYVQETGNPPKDYPLTSNTKVVYLDNNGIEFSKNDNSLKGKLLSNTNSTIYLIELPQEMIYPGKFVLTIVDKNKKDTAKYNYKVQWIDIPKSLVNATYAQEIMYYILNDVEISELKSAKAKDKEGYIYKYWQKHDPTPKTFYNEAMNEYFKRADEAKTKFSTILHSDGAKTSRGQVYMLNGNPDSMINELKDKKPVEHWQYTKLKKQFIFEITTPGEYKLIQIIE